MRRTPAEPTPLAAESTAPLRLASRTPSDTARSTVGFCSLQSTAGTAGGLSWQQHGAGGETLEQRRRDCAAGPVGTATGAH